MTNETTQEEFIQNALSKETLYQPSGAFLSKIAFKLLPGILHTLIGEPKDSNKTVLLQILFKDALIKLNSYKWVNGLLYLPMLFLAFLSIAFPLINHFVPFFSNAVHAGTVQSALICLSVAFYGLYKQYKQKQIYIEDAMRKTLCINEDIDSKLTRMVETIGKADKVIQMGKTSTS